MKFISALILLFSIHVCFAWSSAEHRVIAYIAYQNLTPKARQQINHITKTLFKSHYPDGRFMKASVWPDDIKRKGKHDYDAWHYINYPRPQSHNIVWALNRSINILRNRATPPSQQAFYLSFIIHLVGDIHQPLHCISLYSKRFPDGDQGGNLYLIHSKSKNLHRYWDNALNAIRPGRRGYVNYWRVKNFAMTLMQRYPVSSVVDEVQYIRPEQWAKQSNQLAKHYAYSVAYNTKPSKRYVQKGRQVAEQQMTLAAYRLASLLNQLYY